MLVPQALCDNDAGEGVMEGGGDLELVFGAFISSYTGYWNEGAHEVRGHGKRVSGTG
jgi:hypothetical protein